MKLLLCSLALLLFVASAAMSQTPAELRARYGEPRSEKHTGRRTTEQRFLVRPAVELTIKYDRRGRAREAWLKPVPGAPLPEVRPEHPPNGPYMPTAEVIAVLNELVPPSVRGKLIGAGTFNGGDPEMKLHHPGCSGNYLAIFERVTFSVNSWCWGGTFDASIRWEQRKRPVVARPL